MIPKVPDLSKKMHKKYEGKNDIVVIVIAEEIPAAGYGPKNSRSDPSSSSFSF